ncbi:sensory rhodopsin III [Haloarcula sp. Atlit-7R]|jgi:sensory rhodopsin|uniref:sensory rhodopsin III n=1 Tax=Haloarcula sp. Atlit-7R TaxID=2282125 RepID=UPI000EF1516F|nr:sensory rhodopsin III [Haloarcula sp. Atlit-7R]RLM95584.1 opsin [Haloarcula sp. Atlit-7R]
MAQEIVWYGAGAGTFFVSAVVFVWFAATRGSLGSSFYYLPPIHASVAGAAYVAMALTAGGQLGGSVSITTLRFADWIISTPIITYYLARLAGVDTQTRWLAVAANVVMIGVGYGFVSISGSLRWVAFAVSSVVFLGLLYLYVKTFARTINTATATVRSLFLSLRDLTVVTWSLYPVVYFLGPIGAGIIQTPDLNFLVAILDTVAKVGFMSILLVRYNSVETFVDSWSVAPAE